VRKPGSESVSDLGFVHSGGLEAALAGPKFRRTTRRAYGNIRHRGPIRWQARYTGPDRVRRPIGTFESEKAANAALARVLSDVYQGTYREPEMGDVPLREHAQRWLVTRDLKPSPRDGYERLLRRWILTLLPSPGGARQLDLGALPTAFAGAHHVERVVHRFPGGDCHSSLGDVPPAEFEQNHYVVQPPTNASSLRPTSSLHQIMAGSDLRREPPCWH
jgi:hypothetical protein